MVIAVIVVASLCLLPLLLGSGAMDKSSRQVWVGNIPAGMGPTELMEVLHEYGVRPHRVKVNSRGVHQEQFAIATFASDELAALGQRKKVVFWTKKVALLRPSYVVVFIDDVFIHKLPSSRGERGQV